MRPLLAIINVIFLITIVILKPTTADPVGAAPTLDWDSRLDGLNVTYQPASDCSQGCWRLVSAQYEDEQESQGLHHIWARALDQNGTEQEGQAWNVVWPEGSQSLTTKPPGEWADYPMYACYNPDDGPGGYRAWMGNSEAQSDQVQGMGLPQCLHVSFRLIWQWDPGGETATPVPTSTSQPTSTVSQPPNSTSTATPTSAPASPTATPMPLEWDSRLDGLNVTYHPASDCSQGCWRLVSALYEDPNQSGGAHNIFARIRNENGTLLVDAPWHVAWPDGDVRILTKPEPDWADFSIFACYNPDDGPGGSVGAMFRTN